MVEEEEEDDEEDEDCEEEEDDEEDLNFKVIGPFFPLPVNFERSINLY